MLRGFVTGLSSYPSLNKDNTMPSISSSPQEEVGQSHLSRRVPLARSDAPAGAATRGIRAPRGEPLETGSESM